MSELSETYEKGLLRVFLSSTFRDLKEMRKKLLAQLISAFEGSAMEYFAARGVSSQIVTLEELKKSDIILFLISSYYGSDISECEFIKKCKATCGMKDGTERISYTWCEYRFSISENKPHQTYLIQDNWPSRSQALKIWQMRDEIEKEFCPRIKTETEGITKVINDLAKMIIIWYAEHKINFNKFCGRRVLLKTLFNQINKTVEVVGIGGIGKTTICDVTLLIHKLLGRNIVCIRLEEGYSSGSGYEFAHKKLPSYHLSDATIDNIVDILDLGDGIKGLSEDIKIDIILRQLDKDLGTILLIDNFKENEGLRKLIRKGTQLTKGCILITSKRELGLGFYRLPVASMEEERDELVKIIASRMGKEIMIEESKRIEEISEGHPIAIHLLISNLGRIPIDNLQNFKEGLDFSREEDVMEYMNRLIKNSISFEAYNLIKDLAVLEKQTEIEIVHYAFLETYPNLSIEIFGELLDAFIIDRKGENYIWSYYQIQEVVLEDKPERHRLAAEYYRKKLEKYHKKLGDKILFQYHTTKFAYNDPILQS